MSKEIKICARAGDVIGYIRITNDDIEELFCSGEKMILSPTRALHSINKKHEMIEFNLLPISFKENSLEFERGIREGLTTRTRAHDNIVSGLENEIVLLKVELDKYKEVVDRVEEAIDPIVSLDKTDGNGVSSEVCKCGHHYQSHAPFTSKYGHLYPNLRCNQCSCSCFILERSK